MSQEKSTTMAMPIFLGVQAMYYGIVQVENCKFSVETLHLKLLQ